LPALVRRGRRKAAVRPSKPYYTEAEVSASFAILSANRCPLELPSIAAYEAAGQIGKLSGPYIRLDTEVCGRLRRRSVTALSVARLPSNPRKLGEDGR